ncbi:B-box zinc finger protein [Chloroflexota bacterium]
MKCAAHPDIETNLTCNKCGKPICPKCLVHTPVGARCPSCARMAKLPTYRVSSQYYLRAIAAGIGVAIICGIIWGIIEFIVPFFSFNLLLAPAAGYAISEGISRSVNHKRGRGLAVVAGIAVAISYLVNIFIFGGFPSGLFSILYHLLALGLGIYVAVNRLR